jgi:hypothetical protein
MPRGSKPSRPEGLIDDATGEVTIARSPLDAALSTLTHDEPQTPAPVPLAAVVSRAPGERGAVPTRAQTDAIETVVRDTPELVAQTATADEDKSTTKMPPIELSRALTFSEALEPEIEIQRPLSDSDLSNPGPRDEPSVVAELDSGDMEAVSGDRPAVANGSPPPVTPMPRAPVAPPPPMPLPANTPTPTPVARKTPSALGQVEPEPEPIASPPAPSKRRFWALVGAVLATGGVVAVVVAWKQSGGAKPTDKVAAPAVTHQAQKPAPAPSPSPAPKTVTPSPPSAPKMIAAGSGAGTGQAEKPVSDAMAVTSTPAGATVFLDGAEQGTTPITLPTARDKHTVAVVLAGYALYTKEVDGPQPIDAKLAAVTPTGGPAGIKVKCKTKERYYVFVDGAATGQLCPTERINVSLGPHTVEVYDLVSESRTQYPVVVKDTEHSLRVKVD